MRFTSYENRELVLANAHKLAGSSRIIPDLPVIMRKEMVNLQRRHIKPGKLHIIIRDKGLELFLEV